MENHIVGLILKCSNMIPTKNVGTCIIISSSKIQSQNKSTSQIVNYSAHRGRDIWQQNVLFYQKTQASVKSAI